MSGANPSVLIIDDDPEFRDSVARVLRSVGLHTQQFSSVSDFFNAPPPDGPTCLVLDIRMPGRSGLELHRHLVAAGYTIPTILVTVYPDEVVRRRALKDGVVCYLSKPVDDDHLERCLRCALQSGRTPEESS